MTNKAWGWTEERKDVPLLLWGRTRARRNNFAAQRNGTQILNFATRFVCKR